MPESSGSLNPLTRLREWTSLALDDPPPAPNVLVVPTAHVVQLDVDDTLIPTTYLCDTQLLDKELAEFPEEDRRRIEELDEHIAELFDLLHKMVVVEDIGSGNEDKENFILSVVIVTNATMSHIETVMDKFLPKTRQLLESRNIKLGDIACSAREMWSTEFPYEWYYDFWKAWTLEDILSEIRVEGLKSVTVLSIGDDEPERRAAAYVTSQIGEFAQAYKSIKCVVRPHPVTVIKQIKYITSNLRQYIHGDKPFDLYLCENGDDLEEHHFKEKPEIPAAFKVAYSQFERRFSEFLESFSHSSPRGQNKTLRMLLASSELQQAALFPALVRDSRQFETKVLQINSEWKKVFDNPVDILTSRTESEGLEAEGTLDFWDDLVGMLHVVVRFTLCYPQLVFDITQEDQRRLVAALVGCACDATSNTF